ncbi:MAG TPA: T9SS type A sorting domain-containing protein, partial [Puia sp.]|nr:T9SS type A sorting domain-containing protein [Puia sp.]
VFQLTIKDNNGAVSTATVKIKVVDNLRSVEQFILYPNPAKDIVNLRLINDSLGTLRINIFDMTGKQVLVSEMSKQQNYFDQSLNISGLARGMYTVQIFIGPNKRIVAKLIKQ